MQGHEMWAASEQCRLAGGAQCVYVSVVLLHTTLWLMPSSIRGAAGPSIMQYTSRICLASLALYHIVMCNLHAVRPHHQQQHHCNTDFCCMQCLPWLQWGGMSHCTDKEG